MEQEVSAILSDSCTSDSKLMVFVAEEMIGVRGKDTEYYSGI